MSLFARSFCPALAAAIRGNGAPILGLWVFIAGSLNGAALAAITQKSLEAK